MYLGHSPDIDKKILWVFCSTFAFLAFVSFLSFIVQVIDANSTDTGDTSLDYDGSNANAFFRILHQIIMVASLFVAKFLYFQTTDFVFWTAAVLAFCSVTLAQIDVATATVDWLFAKNPDRVSKVAILVWSLAPFLIAATWFLIFGWTTFK